MASVFWNVFACCRRIPQDDQDEPNERTPLRRGANELNLPGARDRSQDENARHDRLMNILRTVADNMVDVSSNSPFRAEARLGLPSASPHRGRSIRARTPSPHTPSAAGATHAGPASVRAATPTTVPRVPRVNLRHVRGAPRGRVPTLGTGAGRGAPLSKRTMQIAPDPDEDDAAGNGNGNGHGEPTPSVRVEVSDHDSQSSSHPEPEAGAPQNAIASLATTKSQQRRLLQERKWDDD